MSEYLGVVSPKKGMAILRVYQIIEREHRLYGGQVGAVEDDTTEGSKAKPFWFPEHQVGRGARGIDPGKALFWELVPVEQGEDGKFREVEG